MVDYDMVHFPPSQVACAAYALTLKVFNCGEWVSAWGQFVWSFGMFFFFLTSLFDTCRHLLFSIIWATPKMHWFLLCSILPKMLFE